MIGSVASTLRRDRGSIPSYAFITLGLSSLKRCGRADRTTSAWAARARCSSRQWAVCTSSSPSPIASSFRAGRSRSIQRVRRACYHPGNGGSRVSPILKIGPGEDDEDRELSFELDYLLSLTTEQRFEMMFRRSREIAEELIRHGHRKPFEVVKRS